MTYPGGLQVGGGVNADNAAEFLDVGASHVIVTSYVFREGRLEEERLKGLVRRTPLHMTSPCNERAGPQLFPHMWQKAPPHPFTVTPLTVYC